MGFPCNQFRLQEPASNFEINTYTQDVNTPPQPYPIFAKTTVNDDPVLCQPEAPDGSCNRGYPMCTDGNVQNCLPTSTRCCMSNNGVYDYLKGVLPGDLDWNFVKFLVDQSGTPVRRYVSSVPPLDIADDIQSLLQGRKLAPFNSTRYLNASRAH